MIDRLFIALQPLFRIVYTRPGRVVAVALLLAGLGLWGTLQLHVDSDLSRLLPPSYPSVQALEELRDQIGGESELAVMIESPSFSANRQFAEALIPRALRLTGPQRSEPYFTRVDYRHDTEFVKQNALYFATTAELDSLEQFLQRTRRQARLEANPFYVELDEDDDPASSETVDALQELYTDLVTSEYAVSPDSTLLVVRLYPSGAQTDLAFIRAAYRDLRGLVADVDPTRFHPQMRVELGGRLERQWIEVRAITRDVAGSFGTGILTLLLLVMAYFVYKNTRARRSGARDSGAWRRAFRSELLRSPLTALVLGLPLAVSLAWTFGIVYLVYGRLNLMTSTLGLVLFGLGIDFGIHFLARYTEERGNGQSVAEAMEQTFHTTGRAIAAVALTTAGGFFVLLWADFRGFSQFGFTAGLGTLFALLAMLTLLPALLAVFERLNWLRPAPGAAASSSPSEAASSPSLLTAPRRRRWVARGLLVGSLAAVGIAVLQLDAVRFEYDFGELEPRYEAYEARKSKARTAYSSHGSRNAAYVLTDTPEDAQAVARILRRRQARDTTSPTIEGVETIHDRFPTDAAAQAEKLDRIARIRTLLDDPFLQAADDVNFARLRRAASTRAPIPLDRVPAFVKNPFLTKAGTVANVVIIDPSVGLADGRNSMAFADDVSTIELPDGTVYHAASTSLVASDMLRLMIEEAPLMIGLTLLIVVVFKLIVLQTVRWVLVALLPLAASFVWTFGWMGGLGFALNFYNLVVLPTILGIGDDSGIHVVHRYLEEGRGRLRAVLHSTGEHVAVSAITTMVGFSGLMWSMHPGLRSIGYLAVLGISMTLVAALATLPALLYWLERRTAPPSDAPPTLLGPAGRRESPPPPAPAGPDPEDSSVPDSARP